jgi:hypothetical protein
MGLNKNGCFFYIQRESSDLDMGGGGGGGHIPGG